MLDNFCQQKKLYEVFKEVRVEIHKNNKGTYVVLLTKEFLCAFGDVWDRRLKSCRNCEMDGCFFCKRFQYVFNEFSNADIQKHKFLNNLWRVYLNLNEYGFNIEHILDQLFCKYISFQKSTFRCIFSVDTSFRLLRP